jgi:hypothetical protein
VPSKMFRKKCLECLEKINNSKDDQYIFLTTHVLREAM